MAASFARIIDLLSSYGVEYIVVGGLAMGLHGSARRTGDVDVLYRRSAENIERLVAALRTVNPRLRVAGEPDGVPFICDERTIANGANFTLTTDLGDLDVLGKIDGIGSYDEALGRTDVFEVGSERQIHVLSIGALIDSKRATGRRKDLDAIPELECIQELERVNEGAITLDDLEREQESGP